MTKISRCLTILVTVLAVAFLGVASVTTASRTNWQQIATKDFPTAKITEMQAEIAEKEKQTKLTSDLIAGTSEAIAADVKAMTDPGTGREAVLERELEAQIAKAHEVAVKAEAEARKADARLDELKLRREDTVRLQNQFDELVSQKGAALAEVKRLKDLLFQAQGVLERAIRRREALQKEFDKEFDGYEPKSSPSD